MKHIDIVYASNIEAFFYTRRELNDYWCDWPINMWVMG